MAIVRHRSTETTVATIAERDALTPRIDQMTVVVLDATSDFKILSGRAVYKWDAKSSKWLLIVKENVGLYEVVFGAGAAFFVATGSLYALLRLLQ